MDNNSIINHEILRNVNLSDDIVKLSKILSYEADHGQIVQKLLKCIDFYKANSTGYHHIPDYVYDNPENYHTIYCGGYIDRTKYDHLGKLVMIFKIIYVSFIDDVVDGGTQIPNYYCAIYEDGKLAEETNCNLSETFLMKIKLTSK